MDGEMMIVLTTVPNQTAGEELASKIVEARLAACVQVLPRMASIYIWKGAVVKDDEHLLLIKTLPEKFQDLSSFITSHHAYELPEIVGMDAAKVSAAYLGWMNDVLSG
jgi:periplasmic divalent cation tolerance protein